MENIEQEIIGNLKQSGFKTPEGSDTKEKEPTEGVKLLAQKWQSRIDLAKQSMENGDFEDSIKVDRQYVRGEHEDDGSGELVRANLIHAHIRKTVNQIYARNPKFSIRPTETISQIGVKKMRLFGKTAEIVLNRVFDDADLKRRAKACLRSAKTTGIGWAKVYYQTDIEPNPIIRNKIMDSNAQLEQLEYLKKQSSDPSEVVAKERAILELKQFKSQLEKEEHIVVSEGLVIDVVDPTNMVLDLSTVQNFDDYLQIPFLAERIVMSVADAKKRWGKLPVGTKEFKLKSSDAVDFNKEQIDEHATLVHIWEIHDKENRLIHYMADGGTDFLQPPLEPKFVSEQWYPYVPLALNIVDGQFLPMSDVFLLRELQDEHNSARTRFAHHRDISIPHWVSRRGDVSDMDAKALENALPGENVRIDGPAGQPIRNSIDVFSPPPIDPSVYTTDHTERDFERVVGGGEVTQPKNNRSRTLGEAQLLGQEQQTQSAADTDEIEDWFEKVAKHTLELLLQALTPEQVSEMAGPSAEPEIDQQTGEPTGEMRDGSVWPQLMKEQIFNLLTINIQAGSSGKPNKDKETQTWVQFLLPKLSEAIQAIAQLRESGQNDLAEAMIIVAQETLRRLDERFDVHEFLPKEKDKSEPDPQKQQQMQQQMEMQQIQIDQLKATVEETQSETQKNLAQAEKYMVDAQDNDSDIAMKNFKTNTDLAIKRKQLEQMDKQLEVQRDANEMKRMSEMESNEVQREANQYNRISQKESNMNKTKT